MPELPDVEVFRLVVEDTCLDRRVHRGMVSDPALLAGISKEKLEAAVQGAAVQSAKRHGKHLFIGLGEAGWLELHFGMTGFLQFFPDSRGASSHERFRLEFNDSSRLVYDCQRKLGQIGLIQDIESLVRRKGLGPDPCAESMDSERFASMLSKKRGSVKSALMDQSFLAGIGNVYADEILLAAGLHPRTKVQILGRQDSVRLYETMQSTISEAVRRGADPEQMPDFLVAQRGKDGKCPRCGGPLEKITVSSRSTYFCPHCQGEG